MMMIPGAPGASTHTWCGATRGPWGPTGGRCGGGWRARTRTSPPPYAMPERTTGTDERAAPRGQPGQDTPGGDRTQEERRMLRIILEAWTPERQTLGELRILNDGTGDAAIGHYTVTLLPGLSASPAPIRRVRVENYPRDQGAWGLV